MAGLTMSGEIARDNARINGVKKFPIPGPSLLVNNVAYTQAQIEAVYQADIDAVQEVQAAHTALAAALAKAEPVRAATSTFDAAFRLCVEGAYGTAPDAMTTYGMPKKPRRAMTSEEKAAAKVKAAATRAARHTMGKRQKASIKPVDVTVSMVSASAVAPALPAASAPSVGVTSTGVAAK
jgi:hypothetical protein